MEWMVANSEGTRAEEEEAKYLRTERLLFDDIVSQCGNIIRTVCVRARAHVSRTESTRALRHKSAFVYEMQISLRVHVCRDVATETKFQS